jgi:hypothetical protein
MASAPRPHNLRLSRPILAILCALAAGCGGADDGDGRPSDDQQILTAVERIMES